MKKKSSSRVFLIDAHGLCYRAFYAIKNLKTSHNQPTNAVFGFCNIIRKLIADNNPTHIAVCFDVAKQTHRQKKFPDYKKQRQSMPDDLVSQIPIIRRIIKAYGFPIFELEGFEADDVMATLSRRFAKLGVDVFVATDDKDMYQLVGEHIKLYSPREARVLDVPDVEAKLGVTPAQITDYIALAGDSSDNIPGVNGIGQMGARKLLGEFKSIEGIYKHLDKIPNATLREKLIKGQKEAFLSKELATIDPQLPLKATLDDLAFVQPNRQELFEIFKDLEFQQWAKEYAPADTWIESPVAELKNWLEIQEGGQPLYIVYDLKSLFKSGQVKTDILKQKVFDVSIAHYLLADGSRPAYHMPDLRTSEQGLQQLYEIQKKLLKEQGLEFLFYEVEMPLVGVLFEMEQHGVALDLDVLKSLSQECQYNMQKLEESLFKMAGTRFNINSPKQLSDVLFQRLQLPVVKKIKTGFSTNEEVLSKLSEHHPLPALILEYRQMAKLKSTYLDALPALVDAKTGRLHTTFDQTGAQTGRLSSNNPNLQNIPVRTDLGQRIRRAFVPCAKDHVLLAADYSQIELRILAHLSQDQDLKKAFEDDGDIHRYTASLMFDVPSSEVDEKMRYAAKRINFGIVYGMSAFGLSKDLHISPTQAQDFIDKYFLRYPKVRAFLDGEIQKARDCGYVTTLFGRRRYLPDIHNRNLGLRQFAERQAINAPMQGTAADLIKIAMVRIAQKINEKNLSSKMIMTVHDELVFDVPENELKIMAALVREQMEGALDLSVPMKVHVEAGPNWLEMEKI